MGSLRSEERPLSEERQSDLLNRIARCSNVLECVESRRKDHPCARIVGVQQVALQDRQLPEPWSGDLERAPLLFLGSNPPLGRDEEFPRWSWPDEELADFFLHRFGGVRRPWVTAGLHPLQADGQRGPRFVHYWASVNKRASELLGTRDPRPGVDYALSEVVHCKSTREKGVKGALEECTSRYLQALVSISGARVVVCLGKVASGAVRRRWKVPYDYWVFGPEEVGGSLRYFAFLDHPAGFGRKSFSTRLTASEIRGLQLFLAVGAEGKLASDTISGAPGRARIPRLGAL